jgi:hypothetical protein
MFLFRKVQGMFQEGGPFHKNWAAIVAHTVAVSAAIYEGAQATDCLSVNLGAYVRTLQTLAEGDPERRIDQYGSILVAKILVASSLIRLTIGDAGDTNPIFPKQVDGNERFGTITFNSPLNTGWFNQASFIQTGAKSILDLIQK